MESLNETIVQLKKEVLELQEGRVASTGATGEQVSAEQHQLLALKVSVKDDEIARLREEYRRADEEREMCLKKIGELQEDNQELVKNITMKEEVGSRGEERAVEVQRVGGEAIQAGGEDEGDAVPAQADRGGEAGIAGAAGGREEAARHAAAGETEGRGSHV